MNCIIVKIIIERIVKQSICLFETNNLSCHRSAVNFRCTEQLKKGSIIQNVYFMVNVIYAALERTTINWRIFRIAPTKCGGSGRCTFHVKNESDSLKDNSGPSAGYLIIAAIFVTRRA